MASGYLLASAEVPHEKTVIAAFDLLADTFVLEHIAEEMREFAEVVDGLASDTWQSEHMWTVLHPKSPTRKRGVDEEGVIGTVGSVRSMDMSENVQRRLL
jgi:hypothetical protein